MQDLVFPEEILNIVLKDDNSGQGGVSFIGETLGDFLKSVDCFDGNIYDVETLNAALNECGIKSLYLGEFKSQNAWDLHDNTICYITDSGDCYSYNDFLSLADGSEEVAFDLFDIVSWQHPETVLDEEIREGEIDRCKCCGKLYMSYNKETCDNCSTIS